MTFEETMENVAEAFEAVGVSVIVGGALIATLAGFRDFRNLNRLFADVRRDFGRPLILGLEILVAADIIKTITVEASLESVAVLGHPRRRSDRPQLLARHRGRRHAAVASSRDRGTLEERGRHRRGLSGVTEYRRQARGRILHPIRRVMALQGCRFRIARSTAGS